MTLEVSGTLQTSAKIQYLLHTLFCGEALRHLEKLSDEVESSNSLILEAVILRLVMYFPL